MSAWGDFYPSFLGPAVMVGAGVVVDWPDGVAAKAAAIGFPHLGVGWAVAIGLVGGVFGSALAGVIAASGKGWLAGLCLGMLCGALIGTGLRGSADDLALGLAMLAGILLGPLVLGRRLRAVMAEVSAYHHRS